MNRNKIQIYLKVLQFCNSGGNKSCIMRRCGLGGSQMYKTINFLLEGGFLKVERKEFKREDGVETTLKVHTTTHLGHVLIMAIENVNILLDGENSVKDFNMRNK